MHGYRRLVFSFNQTLRARMPGGRQPAAELGSQAA